MTTDLTKAREWLESWTDVSGVEGSLVKPLTSRYLTGYRGWTKIRRRDITETIVGAITGTQTRPQLLALGRHDTGGHLWGGRPHRTAAPGRRPAGRRAPHRGCARGLDCEGCAFWLSLAGMFA
ncbi:hypothetical protein ACFYNW_38110 [Streptomyces virginiae]|uniref:hypothetical protein n=1 Tax=Streptomyces virginiae TaxID=1961 RepID=UPI00342F1210